jgi:hypothetical protein
VRAAGDAADATLARGEHGPLLGLPMTVKGQFNVAGLPTTWGEPKFRGRRPDAEALAVARLKGDFYPKVALGTVVRCKSTAEVTEAADRPLLRALAKRDSKHARYRCSLSLRSAIVGG